jgi:hypothetical protein
MNEYTSETTKQVDLHRHVQCQCEDWLDMGPYINNNNNAECSGSANIDFARQSQFMFCILKSEVWRSSSESMGETGTSDREPSSK